MRPGEEHGGVSLEGSKGLLLASATAREGPRNPNLAPSQVFDGEARAARAPPPAEPAARPAHLGGGWSAAEGMRDPAPRDAAAAAPRARATPRAGAAPGWGDALLPETDEVGVARRRSGGGGGGLGGGPETDADAAALARAQLAAQRARVIADLPGSSLPETADGVARGAAVPYLAGRCAALPLLTRDEVPLARAPPPRARAPAIPTRAAAARAAAVGAADAAAAPTATTDAPAAARFGPGVASPGPSPSARAAAAQRREAGAARAASCLSASWRARGLDECQAFEPRDLVKLSARR